MECVGGRKCVVILEWVYLGVGFLGGGLLGFYFWMWVWEIFCWMVGEVIEGMDCVDLVLDFCILDFVKLVLVWSWDVGWVFVINVEFFVVYLELWLLI